MKVDRKSEGKYCRVCHSTFNHTNNQPVCLMPCGHTFCRTCADSFGKVDNSNNNHGSERSSVNRSCPLCHQRFNQIIPDYEMIDMMNSLIKFSVKTDNEAGSNTEPEDEHGDRDRAEVRAKQSEQDGDGKSKAFVLREEIVHLIKSGTKDQQLLGTQTVRKLLSIAKNPPIQDVIDAGLVPTFIEFLGSKNKLLQFESAWVITNIASGNSDQTKEVVKCGAVATFCKLITESDDENLIEQSIWALGNIAGDSGLHRDLVLDHNILPALIKVIENKEFKSSTIKNAVWCLSNLCRGKTPHVAIDRIKPAFPLLKRLITEYNTSDHDEEILIDSCWAVSYLSDGSNERIQEVLNNFSIERLVELLCHHNMKIVTPCLHIIGNIASGNDTQTQILLDHNVLPALKKLLDHEKNSIRKECCWTLSNITAGTSAQIQQVIDANLIPQVIQIYFDSDISVKKEALWVLANAMTSIEQHIKYFVDQKVIDVFVEVLTNRQNDVKFVQLAIESFEKLLALAEKPDSDVGRQIDAIVRSIGLENILQEVFNNAQTTKIQTAVESLLDYFGTDDDDDVQIGTLP